MSEIYIVAGVRTAIGEFGGSLSHSSPAYLATEVTKAAIQRSSLAPELIEHVVFGQVIPTEPADAYLARVATLGAGVPISTPAMTVNRLCGSGLQAIISAAQHLMLGDADIVVGGGAEVMSRAPFFSSATRWGKRLGDTVLMDGLQGALTDPFHKILMGVTAENVASAHHISRQEQDQCALLSHQRAQKAIESGRFETQILPLEFKKKGQTVVFDKDEHVRPLITLDDLSRLRPVFQPEGGSVTAGNSSGINDGAAAVLLCNKTALQQHGLKPMARIVAYAHSGVEPELMGLGPITATKLALKRANLHVDDLDVIESNEAFAAQACAVSKSLGFNPERVNPNGSGIALGHPVGATGAINTVKLIYELERCQGRYGLVTMCIGGGQGIAMIVERC